MPLVPKYGNVGKWPDTAGGRVGRSPRSLKSGVEHMIVTLGANGALRAVLDGTEHLMAYRINPVDTTGAGDAFIGSFATFLAEEFSESEMIVRAHLCAALSTLSLGTQPSFVSRDRLESAWKEWRPRV
jgi:ribokinase